VLAWLPPNVVPSSLGADPREINANAFDPWSYVHAFSGVLFGACGVSAPWSFGTAAVYEIIEYAHEWPKGSVLFGSKRPESLLNIVTDMALFAGGWYVGTRLNRAAR
jgi:hypothetical protein